VGIKFNDQHIPDSPYKLFISPAMGDAHKLEVFQFPNSGVQADKPAAFLVRKNGAKGELDAKVSIQLCSLYLKPTHALISKHTFTFTFIKTLKLVKNVL
jgi:hypothetical protein